MLAGQADLAVVADVPAMLSIADQQKIAILAVVYRSRHAAALLVRADHGIASLADLKGRTVATVGGTNVDYLLDKMLVRQHMDRSAMAIRSVGPDALASAFRRGEVDAITSWQPVLAQLQVELGPKALAIHETDLFVFRFLLVSTEAYAARHSAQTQRVLAALADSADSMKAAPSLSKAIIARRVAIDGTLLARFFEPGDYAPVLDQSLLVALDDQTRWAMARGLIGPGPIPNYLDFIPRRPMRAAVPGGDRMMPPGPQ